MGKGFPVDVANIDPSSPRFMLIDEDTETAVKKALEAELAKEGGEDTGDSHDGATHAGEQRASA